MVNAPYTALAPTKKSKKNQPSAAASIHRKGRNGGVISCPKDDRFVNVDAVLASVFWLQPVPLLLFKRTDDARRRLRF